MKVGSADSAAVVVAQQFNPSVVSQRWLEDLGLLKADDLVKEPFAFTSAFTQFSTREYSFFLIPERLLFGLRVPAEEQKSLLMGKFARFIKSVPHTPYTGLGLNFSYKIQPDDGDTCTATRSLFFRGDSQLYREFDAPDARFGAYFSRDVFGCRLKLDVRPAVVAANEGEVMHLLQMEFNFHHEITSGTDAADAIIRHLDNWDEAREYAAKLVKMIARE
jgi:hypothetical protein